MPGRHDNSVYNARIQEKSLRRAYCFRSLCLCLAAASTILASAADWRVPEAQLARQIAAATGPGAVTLEIDNRSALASAEVEAIRRGLTTELAGLGVQLAPADQSAATIKVALSTNLQSYVWIAKIQVGNNEPSVVMVTAPRTESVDAERSLAPLTIHKALLWTEDSRILDVALPPGTPQLMIVLEAEQVALYSLQGDHWQPQRTLPITHPHPWPRDLRGRLFLRNDHLFDVYLPGVFCRSTSTAPLSLDCRESDDPWPLAGGQTQLSAFFAPARNFFTGVLSPGVKKQTATSPFYAAASLPREKYTLWLFSTVEGQVHVLDGLTDQVAANWGWGSDIAAVHSGCGGGWQILVSSRSDGGNDRIRAFEIADREAAGLSDPVDLGGTVTALWSDSEGTTAIAVAQDSETGQYEASRLSITCSR